MQPNDIAGSVVALVCLFASVLSIRAAIKVDPAKALAQ